VGETVICCGDIQEIQTGVDLPLKGPVGEILDDHGLRVQLQRSPADCAGVFGEQLDPKVHLGRRLELVDDRLVNLAGDIHRLLGAFRLGQAHHLIRKLFDEFGDRDVPAVDSSILRPGGGAAPQARHERLVEQGDAARTGKGLRAGGGREKERRNLGRPVGYVKRQRTLKSFKTPGDRGFLAAGVNEPELGASRVGVVHSCMDRGHVDGAFELCQLARPAEVIQQHDRTVLRQLHSMAGDVHDEDVLGMGVAGVSELDHGFLHAAAGGGVVGPRDPRCDARFYLFTRRRRQQNAEAPQRRTLAPVVVQQPGRELGRGSGSGAELLHLKLLALRCRFRAVLEMPVLAHADHQGMSARLGQIFVYQGWHAISYYV